MTRSLEDIYENISAMIIKGTEGVFSNAILEVELHTLAMRLSGGYFRADHTLSTSSPFHFIKEHKTILLKDLLELQEKMPERPWNIMTYSLLATGEYQVDFEWNDTLAREIDEVCAQA